MYLTGKKELFPLCVSITITIPSTPRQCVRLHLNLHALPTDRHPPLQHYSPLQVISRPASKALLALHIKPECLPPTRLASSSSRAPSTPHLASSSAASRELLSHPFWTFSLADPLLLSCSSGTTMPSSATLSLSQRAGRSSSLNGYVIAK